MIGKEMRKFLQDLLLGLAEQDILDQEKTVDEVIDERFDCPTPKIRAQIRAAVVEWRAKGKVNWKQYISE